MNRLGIISVYAFISGIFTLVNDYSHNCSIINLFNSFMSKSAKPSYINKEIKKISQEDLKKALITAEKNYKEVKESFKVDKETLSFRAGR